MHNRVGGRKKHTSSKPILQRPDIVHMYVHTHEVLGMDGRIMREHRQEDGYTVYAVGSKRASVCLLTTRKKCPRL